MIMISQSHLNKITEYRGIKIERETSDLSSHEPIWSLSAVIEFNIFETPATDKRVAMFAPMPYHKYEIGVTPNGYKREDKNNPTGYENGIWDYTELFEKIDDVLDNKIPKRIKQVMAEAYENIEAEMKLIQHTKGEEE